MLLPFVLLFGQIGLYLTLGKRIRTPIESNQENEKSVFMIAKENMELTIGFFLMLFFSLSQALYAAKSSPSDAPLFLFFSVIGVAISSVALAVVYYLPKEYRNKSVYAGAALISLISVFTYGTHTVSPLGLGTGGSIVVACLTILIPYVLWCGVIWLFTRKGVSFMYLLAASVLLSLVATNVNYVFMGDSIRKSSEGYTSMSKCGKDVSIDDCKRMIDAIEANINPTTGLDALRKNLELK